MMRTMRESHAPFRMRILAGYLLAVAILPAQADEPSPAPAVTTASKGSALSVASVVTLRANDGRLLDLEPEAGLVRLLGHGELQLRGSAMSDQPLDRMPTHAAAISSSRRQALGQRAFGAQWLRLRPTLQLAEHVSVVAQADVFSGLWVGDLTRDVGADGSPRDAYDSIGSAELRWAYLEWRTRWGMLRAGRQSMHWGLGMLANDGDHRPRFGDYRKGTIQDRMLLEARPLGETSPLVFAVAGDRVRRDQFSDDARGDETYQGVAAISWRGEHVEAGVYGAVRQQTNARGGQAALYTDKAKALLGDFYARAVSELTPDVQGFVGAEVAFVAAASDNPRTTTSMQANGRTKTRAIGLLAELGIMGGRVEATGLRAQAKWVFTVEYGHASGQADARGGQQSRFSFDPNHRVGLVLFDEVIRWQTARSATALRDPAFAGAGIPAAGSELLPTNGGVVGTAYVQPSFVFRPDASLDVCLGILLAQATSDVVDPYRVAADGMVVNYTGGAPRGRDYGVEVDGAIEKRWVSSAGLVPQLGLQGGVLFPGTALADEKGNTMRPPWVVQGRAGLQF